MCDCVYNKYSIIYVYTSVLLIIIAIINNKNTNKNNNLFRTIEIHTFIQCAHR